MALTDIYFPLNSSNITNSNNVEVVTRVVAEAEMAVGLSEGPPITFMEAFLEGREVVLDPHPNKTMDGVAWAMDGVAWAEPEMVTWAPEMQAAEALTMMAASAAAAGPVVIGQDSMT